MPIARALATYLHISSNLLIGKIYSASLLIQFLNQLMNQMFKQNHMKKGHILGSSMEATNAKISYRQLAVKGAFETYYELKNRLETLKSMYPNLFKRIINKKSYRFYTDPNGLMLITNVFKDYYFPQLQNPIESVQTIKNQGMDWSSLVKDQMQSKNEKMSNKMIAQVQKENKEIDMNQSFWKIMNPPNFQFKSQESQNNSQIQSDQKNLVKIEEDYNPNEKVQRGSKIFKRGPYKSYTIQQKQYAVELLNSGMAITRISADLKIPCKNIKRWSQQGVYRKKGAGRKRWNPELEEQLNTWIRRNFQKGSIIDMELIQQKAILMSTDPQFKASRGWITNFTQRYFLNRIYSIS